jgi:hypothetical protein
MGIYDRVVKRLRSVFGARAEQMREIKQEQQPYNWNSWGFSSASLYNTPYDQYRRALAREQDLLLRMQEYEEMDTYSDITTMLDTYADESTQDDALRSLKVWAESNDETIAGDVNMMLHEQVKLDSYLWSLVRYALKYGNNYERLFLTPERGIIATEPLPAGLTRLVFDPFGIQIGFVVSPTPTMPVEPDQLVKLVEQRRQHSNLNFYGYTRFLPIVAFEEWEVAHFKMPGGDRMDPYGESSLERIRHLWRRLALMEDAAVVHKLTRAPSRYAFYVDTGELSGLHALQYVQRVRDQMKRQKVVGTDGKINTGYNALSPDEDFFIPVSQDRGESVRIDTISGADYQAMDDIKYFQQKIGRASSIPNFASDNQASERPLANTDVRFASLVVRIQSMIKQGVKRMGDVHLLATGRSPSDHPYRIMMAAPSAILELARIEVLSAKADIMSRLQENISVRWMLVQLFGFSDDEAISLMVSRQEELDWVISREIERDFEREKRLNSLREDLGMEGLVDAFGKSKIITELKDSRGAYGITEREYVQGRDKITAEDGWRKIRKTDPLLAIRLEVLGERLHRLHGESRFKQAA